MATKGIQDRIILSKSLLRMQARYDRHSNSYSVTITDSNLVTSNLNEEIRSSLRIYPILDKSEDLKLISNEVVLGILKDGSVIISKVILYDEKKNKLALVIAKPKKHLYFFSLKDFVGLYRVHLWKKVNGMTETPIVPKEANRKSLKKSDKKDSSLPDLFE